MPPAPRRRLSKRVGKAASTTTLTASLASIAYGQKVTLTATVAGQYGGTATGTVTFKIESTELGSAPLASGKVKFTTAYIPAGADSIIASYSADSNFAASKSSALSVTVSKAVLTVTAANQTAVYNQSLPELSYAVSGYVNGDSFSAISGSPLEATTAKQGSAAGSYPITVTQGTLSSTDYSFKFVNGTLENLCEGGGGSYLLAAGRVFQRADLGQHLGRHGRCGYLLHHRRQPANSQIHKIHGDHPDLRDRHAAGHCRGAGLRGQPR
jgi:hypothetical protein